MQPRLLVETCRHALVDKVLIRIERLIRLRDDEIVLLVRREVAHILRHAVMLLVHATIRRLHKSKTVHARIVGERADETDVRTFRRLDRAHAAIVRVVNVAHLKARALTREAAGAECREAALMRQLGERVVLIHELRELRGAEELLYRRHDGADIDEPLRRDALRLLNRHALAHDALHA